MKKLIVLNIIILTGCGQAIKQAECPACKPQVIEVPVVQECEVPNVPQANLEEVKKEDSYEEKLRKLIHNYGKLKEENYLLRKAMEVCK